MSFIADIQASTNAGDVLIKPILKYFDKVSLAKNQSLIKAGEFCNNYYFLESGLLRFFYIENEADKTVYIVFENTLFSDLLSLHNGTPSLYEISAVERSALYSISRFDLEKLAREHHFISEYFRIKWEQNCKNLAEIKLLHQTRDARGRYAFFQKRKDWMRRVPQKYLASYIGITPYSLSRIRGKR